MNHNNDEISVLAVLHLLIKNLKLIIPMGFGFAIIAFVYAKTIPNTYRSFAVILPLDSSGPSISLNVGGLSALPGLGGGQTSEAGKFILFIQSKSLALKVLENENIKNEFVKVYMPDFYSEAEGKIVDPNGTVTNNLIADSLKGLVGAADDAINGSIEVAAITKNPVFSKNLVEAYLKELRNYLNNNTLTLAKRDMLFLEKQLVENKVLLFKEAEAFANFYKYNQVSSSSSLIDIDIDSPANYSLRQTTAKNGNTNLEIIKNGNQVIIKNIPADIYVQYLSKRQMLMQQMNAQLEQQYQVSKIDAQNEELGFQIVDHAEVSAARHKPNRLIFAIVGGFIGGILSLAIIFLKQLFKKYRDYLHEQPS